MVDLTKQKAQVVEWIDRHCAAFFPVSDAIWSFAELGCEERLSADLLVQLLEKLGFSIESGVAGLPTAFVASWGTDGGPVMAFNCEYDALPGLSQHPTVTRKDPLVEGAPGHGCGHNLLGVGSILGAAAVKEWLSGNNRPGRVVVLGAPAEELCIGKPYMAKAGLFDGIDIILDWHPWVYNGANYDTCNAYFNIKYHFTGRTAHGNAPWEGRSALDAALLMAHAIELLREHITPGHPDAANTINYTFPDVGPEYPNVVPDRSTVWVVGRITTSGEMEGIIHRIHRCAEAASIATGTSWRMEFITATHEKIPNRTLASVLHKNLLEVGPPRFNEDEHEMARRVQRDLGVEESGLSEEIMDFGGGSSGVSDNSEYSWFAPFAMAWVAVGPVGVGWHNWQVAAFARSSAGKKAMVVAAKILAISAMELMMQPHIIEEAKKEWAERLSGTRHRPLIPDDAEPPTYINHNTMEKYRPLMEKYYEHITLENFVNL